MADKNTDSRQKLKDLLPGEFFTRKPIEEPKGSQVWVRGAWILAQQRYECQNFDDSSRFLYLKGDTVVFTEFVF